MRCEKPNCFNIIVLGLWQGPLFRFAYLFLSKIPLIEISYWKL
jgi:hypothetical protein